MRRLVLISVLASLSCSSITLDFIPNKAAPGPLRIRPASQVELFTSAPPARAHAEVGVIESQQKPGSDVQSSELIAQMRALAGEHGCDGLVILGSNDAVTETM